MRVAGTSIRSESNSKTVSEESALVARVSNISVLENGFIVLSQSDVAVGGTLNPDAAGNQKFAVSDALVNGTVTVATLGTYRAYLVSGTEVKQRCGTVVIVEPSHDPTLTSLTVAGSTILATSASKSIDENSALAGTIINRSELSNGFVVLSPTVVNVGGSLNPDAAGNQKFAVSADNISGTVDASSVGTLYAYLVGDGVVLQKCGSVIVTAPQAGITAFTAGGTDILSTQSSKNITDGNLSGTYNAKNLSQLSHPRVILCDNLNVAVGSSATGTVGFTPVNGNSQAFSLSGIADGTYRAYLIDASAADGNVGSVVQAMGVVTQSAAQQIITAATTYESMSQSYNSIMDPAQTVYSSGTVRYSGIEDPEGRTLKLVSIDESSPSVGDVVTVHGGTPQAYQAGTDRSAYINLGVSGNHVALVEDNNGTYTLVQLFAKCIPE